MIAPLPQLPLPPLPGEAPGAKPDLREGDDGFAQILAAAAMRTPQLPCSPPIPDHGPAIVPAPIEPAVEATLPDSVLPPGPAELKEAAPVTAEIFNQEGFFGTASASHPANGAAELRGHVTPPPLVIADEVPEGTTLPVESLQLRQVAEGEPSFAPVASKSVSVTPAPVATVIAGPARAAARHQPAIHTSHPPLRPAALAPLGARLSEAEGPAESTGFPARRAVVREPGARSAVQVVLHELEQGLHIAARTEALDEPERARLHDEITALLASHGLSARSVRIHAPVRSALLQEKFR